MNTRRVASVRSETYCNLFSLSVDHLNAVLVHYPEMRRTMEDVAAERLRQMGYRMSSSSSSPAPLTPSLRTLRSVSSAVDGRNDDNPLIPQILVEAPPTSAAGNDDPNALSSRRY